MAGLTLAGFSRARLPDIKATLENELRAALGDDLDVSPQSVAGQLIGVVSKELADIWELAEQVYLSQYSASSEGVSLTSACELVNVRRLGRAKSAVTISATADEGTVIPVGSLVRGGQNQFRTTAAATVSSNNADRVRVHVDGATVGQVFTVTIAGTPIRIIAQSAVAAQVAAQIDAAINTEPVPANAQAEDENVDVLASAGPVSVSVSSGLTITERAAQIPAEAVEFGPVDVTANAITNIVTPIAGWQSVTNRRDGVQGRITEGDIDLRSRRVRGVRAGGAASPEAIRARLLQEVPNLLSASIYENTSDATDAQGRPAHSFETIVEGADDQAVADAIWRLKPAGIRTHGTLSFQVTDASNSAQSVKFSRPAPLYIWARVRVLNYYAEERLPGDAAQRIQEAVARSGNRLAVGEDVIRQRLFRSVYEVPGIGDVEITMASDSASSTNQPANYSASNIQVSHAQRARFDVSRIEVTLP